MENRRILPNEIRFSKKSIKDREKANYAQEYVKFFKIESELRKLDQHEQDLRD